MRILFDFLTQQLRCHSDVVDVGGCGLHCVDKAAARVHAGVALHAKMPLLPCCGIGNVLLKEVDSHELPHSIAIIDSFLNPLIGEAKPALQQVHPQHNPYLNRRTASFSGRIVRVDLGYPLIPQDYLIHDLQKFFGRVCITISEFGVKRMKQGAVFWTKCCKNW